MFLFFWAFSFLLLNKLPSSENMPKYMLLTVSFVQVASIFSVVICMLYILLSRSAFCIVIFFVFVTVVSI